MSTLNLNPPPQPQPPAGSTVVTLTQAQFEELLAKAQGKSVTVKAPPVWWQKLSGWAASKGGWVHALAGVYAAAAIYVDSNAQAHALFTQVWATTPHWLVEIFAAAGPVILLYTGPLKKPTPTEEG